MKAIISLLAAVILMVGFPMDVRAGAPVRVSYELTFLDFPIGPDWCPGYGFGVIADAYYDVAETWFYDKNGDPELLRFHYMIREGAYKNSVDPTRMVTFRGAPAYTVSVDIKSGETVITGGNAHVTVPGHGLLLLDAGRLQIDSNGNITFMAGKWDIWNANFDALCQYLAGP